MSLKNLQNALENVEFADDNAFEKSIVLYGDINLLVAKGRKLTARDRIQTFLHEFDESDQPVPLTYFMFINQVECVLDQVEESLAIARQTVRPDVSPASLNWTGDF